MKVKEVYETPIVEVLELLLEDSIANSGAINYEDIWGGL